MIEDLENGYRIFRETNNEIPAKKCANMEFMLNVNWENIPIRIYRTKDNKYFALPDWNLFINSPYQKTGYAYEVIPVYRCDLRREK